MPRRNRVDPWGDLHAVGERGLLTGNRGCLVDGDGEVSRHHRRDLWIACLTRYRDWRSPLAAPNRWTPIFFLDDAVALAAGHRPCGLCRRAAYRAYRDAVTAGTSATAPLRASELNRMLGRERLRRGRGLDRATDRKLWTADVDRLPDGSVVLDDEGAPRLIIQDRMMSFTFGGWSNPQQRQGHGHVRVLTPPTSVTALANGFRPELHPSAGE